MKKYEILEHKADLQIRVFGGTKEELFQNALLGMQESMKPEIRKQDKETKRKIKIKSTDLSALLVDFLSEVLYLSQFQKEIFFDIIFEKLTDEELRGEFVGQRVARFNEDIKAVTHHQLDVHQGQDGIWQATILFDI